MMIRGMQKPNRTTRRVYDILLDCNTEGFGDDWYELTITVDNTVLATHTMVLSLWLERGDFLFSESDLQHVYNRAGTKSIEGAYILEKWKQYIDRNGENLKRMLDAINAEYNPIDNYNMTEEFGQGEKQDKITNTPHGTITNTTQTNKNGLNSTGDGERNNTVTATQSYTNADTQTDFDNSKSFDFNGSTKTGYHKTLEHYIKRFGNIGVTTSAQMITQEIELRQSVDLIAQFVKRFFDTTCYYVG